MWESACHMKAIAMLHENKGGRMGDIHKTLWFQVITLPNTKHNLTLKCNRDHGTTKTKTKNDNELNFHRDLTTSERKIWAPTTPILLILEACPPSTPHWVEFPTSRFTKLKQFKPMISSPRLCKYKGETTSQWSLKHNSHLQHAKSPNLRAIWSPKVIFYHNVH